jgi:predicted CXXCH cytochrome family protein
MKTNFIRRFAIALMIALIVGAVALFASESNVQASTPAQEPLDCKACHAAVQTTWETGMHGDALSDEIFQKEWQAQGQPGACLVCHTTGYDPTTGMYKAEGVSCESCHSPIPQNHPTDNMPVSETTDLCGSCHSDTRFGWEGWKISTHYQRNMTCTVCHDPHSAGFKTVGDAETADPSALCQNCHKDYMADFPETKHAAAGVNCIDCHLGNNEKSGTFQDAHTLSDHSFTPNLETCNKCHATQMHAPGQSATLIGVAPVEEEPVVVEAHPTEVAQIEKTPETKSPLPVSPIGFAGLAGLLGLAGGMVIAPWLERAYRHWDQSR